MNSTEARLKGLENCESIGSITSGRFNVDILAGSITYPPEYCPYSKYNERLYYCRSCGKSETLRQSIYENFYDQTNISPFRFSQAVPRQ